MEYILDRIELAFLRLFEDISGANFGEILFFDLGIVAAVIAVPLFFFGTIIGGPRN